MIPSERQERKNKETLHTDTTLIGYKISTKEVISIAAAGSSGKAFDLVVVLSALRSSRDGGQQGRNESQREIHDVAFEFFFCF